MPHRSIINSVKEISAFKHVDKSIKGKYSAFYSSNTFYTKREGNVEHHNVFFLPISPDRKMLYLGHHIKAKDWIPPGGHIEPGETTIDTILREFREELNHTISKSQIEPFDLSIKHIGRPNQGCQTHYDIWHLIHTDTHDFDFDRGEYHDAKWLDLEAAISSIEENPEFTDIIKKLRK